MASPQQPHPGQLIITIDAAGHIVGYQATDTVDAENVLNLLPPFAVGTQIIARVERILTDQSPILTAAQKVELTHLLNNVVAGDVITIVRTGTVGTAQVSKGEFSLLVVGGGLNPPPLLAFNRDPDVIRQVKPL